MYLYKRLLRYFINHILSCVRVALILKLFMYFYCILVIHSDKYSHYLLYLMLRQNKRMCSDKADTHDLPQVY